MNTSLGKCICKIFLQKRWSLFLDPNVLKKPNIFTWLTARIGMRNLFEFMTLVSLRKNELMSNSIFNHEFYHIDSLSWVTVIPQLLIVGHHFSDDIFKCIFFNENCFIFIKISLKYVLKGPIDNISALVQIMACGNRPQAIIWTNDGRVWWCIYMHLSASVR